MTDAKRQAALDYHAKPIPGKLSVELTKPTATARDLALAYSPGVAEPVREIARDPENAYLYTGKGNLVAVISDGSAILAWAISGPWPASRSWKARACCSSASPASIPSISRSMPRAPRPSSIPWHASPIAGAASISRTSRRRNVSRSSAPGRAVQHPGIPR